MQKKYNILPCIMEGKTYNLPLFKSRSFINANSSLYQISFFQQNPLRESYQRRLLILISEQNLSPSRSSQEYYHKLISLSELLSGEKTRVADSNERNLSLLHKLHFKRHLFPLDVYLRSHVIIKTKAELCYFHLTQTRKMSWSLGKIAVLLILFSFTFFPGSEIVDGT